MKRAEVIIALTRKRVFRRQSATSNARAAKRCVALVAVGNLYAAAIRRQAGTAQVVAVQPSHTGVRRRTRVFAHRHPLPTKVEILRHLASGRVLLIVLTEPVLFLTAPSQR